MVVEDEFSTLCSPCCILLCSNSQNLVDFLFLDEIDLAWGERGLPKLPSVAAPGDDRGQPGAGPGDDEPPRPDLKFL